MHYALLLTDSEKGLFGYEVERRFQGLRELLNPSLFVVRPLAPLLSLCVKGQTPLAVVTPDIGRFVRDLRDGGVAQALVKRLLSIGILDKSRVAWQIAMLARGLVARDFKAGLRLLLEIEWGEVRRHNPSALFLGGEIADTSFLLGNAEVIRLFERFARKRNVKWGLCTANFCMAAERLAEWRLKPDFILAPFHPRGHGMRPDQKACEDAQCQNGFPTIACYSGPVEGVMQAEVQGYYAKLGIRWVAVNYTGSATCPE